MPPETSHESTLHRVTPWLRCYTAKRGPILVKTAGKGKPWSCLRYIGMYTCYSRDTVKQPLNNYKNKKETGPLMHDFSKAAGWRRHSKLRSIDLHIQGLAFKASEWGYAIHLLGYKWGRKRIEIENTEECRGLNETVAFSSSKSHTFFSLSYMVSEQEALSWNLQSKSFLLSLQRFNLYHLKMSGGGEKSNTEKKLFRKPWLLCWSILHFFIWSVYPSTWLHNLWWKQLS